MTHPLPAAELRDVVKDYPDGPLRRGRLRAVDGVSFRVETGEVVGLLGPNRAGKTTLIKILTSLCRPTSGDAARLGRPVADRSTLARVGVMHEHPAFPRYLTAAELLDYYGALTGLERSSRGRAIPELLERVGLADRDREPIARFSKGMVQRLGLAQAILNDPDLLVLDEPDEGLDLDGRRLVADVVRERTLRGGSVLLVTHVASDVARLSDRIVVLNRGRVAHDGPPPRVPTDPVRHIENALGRLYEGAAR
ncbi:MAG TPA: ABC transporter ATP-binding protein [Isosphaeraceae bacterium]|jgi:ABC-2 type transport system ATP-binding protein|nr:ABC transporter ATP-binding protein [Isosphaeraceae bacterium]